VPYLIFIQSGGKKILNNKKMTFREYYKEPIKESPDVVYSPTQSKLTWYSRDAIAFGTIHGIKGLSPFFVYSLKSSQTHFEMIENIVIKLELAYDKYTDRVQKVDRDELIEVFERALTFDKMWKLPVLDANRVAHEIINSSFLMSKIKSNLMLDYIQGFTWREGKGGSELEKDLTNPVRTKLYKNSGRVWPTRKVISFWLTSEQLTPQILDETFNQLKITDKDSYYIDVVNMEEIEKEETKKKTLPSYKQYKTRKSAPKVSDEQRRKAQELMAKQHGVAGAQKARFKDELPAVGAKKYAQQMPLDVRQKVQTSESKL
jgi:hypothetical protein